MANYPTVAQPLILVYTGAVPSMKNSTKVSLTQREDESGGVTNSFSVGRSKRIRIYLSQKTQAAQEQRIAQKFDLISLPNQIGVWVRLGVYLAPTSKAVMPVCDLDNAYTTIQETWQDSVIENDRQVVDVHMTRVLCKTRPSVHTMVILWTLSPDQAQNGIHCTDQFMIVYNKYREMPTWELLQQQRNSGNLLVMPN